MSKISIPIISGGALSVFTIPPLVPIDLTPNTPLGTAIWPTSQQLSDSTVSISFDSDINYVTSDQIRFVYPLTPIGPMYNSVHYDSVDNDVKFRSKVTKKFYERLFNSYLYDKEDLLKYFKVVNGNVKLVKSEKEYDNNKLDYNDKSEIIEFIVNNVYDKYDLKTTLKKFLRRTNTKWVDLIDNKDDVKILIFSHIKKKIRDIMKKN